MAPCSETPKASCQGCPTCLGPRTCEVLGRGPHRNCVGGRWVCWCPSCTTSCVSCAQASASASVWLVQSSSCWVVGGGGSRCLRTATTCSLAPVSQRPRVLVGLVGSQPALWPPGQALTLPAAPEAFPLCPSPSPPVRALDELHAEWGKVQLGLGSPVSSSLQGPPGEQGDLGLWGLMLPLLHVLPAGARKQRGQRWAPSETLKSPPVGAGPPRPAAQAPGHMGKPLAQAPRSSRAKAGAARRWTP